MRIAWYRKYRPQTFSQVVGQEHIKTTLLNQIVGNKVGHAYLFAGPKGTGKTSLARILARAVNCLEAVQGEPCGKCQNCNSQASGQMIDLIEIDAASHTGVENIRELIDKVNLAPAMCKYKVYVIDEAHMLSKGAFNALLKTLEEPPEHVIFILATTEPHQFPATIISRCQRYDFRYLTTKDISFWLSNIAKEENVKIDDEAINFLAMQAGGSGRDALSLLEQVANMGSDITKDKLSLLLGFVDWNVIFQLTELVIKGGAKEAIQLVNKMYYDGYDLTRLATAWISFTRELLATKLDNQDILGITTEQIDKLSQMSMNLSITQISWLLRELMDSVAVIKLAHVPQTPLEILIVRAVTELAGEIKDSDKPASSGNSASADTPASSDDSAPTDVGSDKDSSDDSDDKPDGEEKNDEEKSTKQEKVGEEETAVTKAITNFQVSDWSKVTEQITKSSPTLGAVLNKTKIEVGDNKITIRFDSVFYKEALERPGNMRLLKEILLSYGRNYTIECLVDSQKSEKKPARSEDHSGGESLAVDEITQVFGKA